ncbi:hypothetical protein H0H81_003658 [Sphagnurus paluster]|uniref:Uncharacterized protein n=1 Tax=Sphagnurus paluster TaxID=117069 RepID=A0A9P7GMF3_9AGAR|nr:hypothetical protein H0H81_003658 [Sphagnurus paluster]
MNSPPDPGSPISTDSESPPPEEISTAQPPSNYALSVRDIGQSILSGAKRRLPTGSSFSVQASSRDPKSRRRIDPGKAGPSTAQSQSQWEAMKEAKREDRDLVDYAVVDFLRKEIGDPFDDSLLQKHA